jgi:beta-lactamase class A
MQRLEHRLPRRSWQRKKQARLWRKEHRRQLTFTAIGLGVFVVLLEAVQLAYPSNRLLPFITIQGQEVGNSSISVATDKLNRQYANASITIKTDTKEFTQTFAQTGITIDAAKSVEEAARYPFWQRVIPFSLAVTGLVRDTPMQASYSQEPIAALAARVQDESHTDSINASIVVRAGRARLVKSVPAKDYPSASVIAAVKQAHFRPKTVVKVVPKATAAPLTDQEASAMLDDVQKLVDNRLVLKLQGKEIEAPKGTKGDWLTFAADVSSSRLDIGLNTELAQKYLESIQGDAYKAPGTTHVQLIDGREVSRTVGENGKGVDMDKAVTAIGEAIKARGDDNLTLEITDLAPVVAYDKKYSNSDKELASLVAGIASAKGGYGISLMEIDGRSANANGDKQFVAASTYKLYVAYAVVREVEAGRMSWTDTVSGRTVEKCFDDMIVVSDNNCPLAFGKQIGWQTINNLIHGLGISSGTRLGSGAMYTTPNDLAYFLYRLEKGSLLSAAGRDRLIAAMKRQSYTRAGIPAGAGGTVADKVGDVDGYLHDGAIVYGSKKTYVLVVMTYGSSWSGIADTASRIDAAVDN